MAFLNNSGLSRFLTNLDNRYLKRTEIAGYAKKTDLNGYIKGPSGGGI